MGKEKNLSPELRFPGFTDDWKLKKLGECFNERSERSKSQDDELLSVTISDGVIRQADSDKRNTSSSDTSNYKMVYPLDIAYNSMRMWQGAEGVSNYTGIVSPAYTVVIPRSDIDSHFFSYMFKKNTMLKTFERNSQGLTSDTWNLKYPAFSKISVAVPSFKEQCSITNILTRIDNLITLHQQKLDSMKDYKKGLLQKMFPKEGEKTPKLRFSGFTDDWEPRKFGDLADYKKGPFGSAITKDMFIPKNEDAVKVYEQQNAINKDWSLERYFLPKEYALTKLKSFQVHGGDIIVSCAGTIGEIYEIPENAESGVINQALMRVRVDESVVNKNMFIIVFSNMIDEFSRTRSNGSAIKNIPPFADLKPMEALLPSIDEQAKISKIFESLDSLITLHQRNLDFIKEYKKGLLKKMFV